MTPPKADTWMQQEGPPPGITRGSTVRMDREHASNLAVLIAGMRPDWHSHAVHAAVLRCMTEHGQKYSAYEISIAMVCVAANPLSAAPSALFGKGAHWDALPAYLNTGEDGKRQHSRHDREVLESAAWDAAHRDPAGSHRGYRAATAALADIRAAKEAAGM